MKHALALCAALASISLTAGRPSYAGEPSAAAAESARAAFLEGLDLREKQGDLPGALEKFKAAHASAPTPRTGYELGKTHLLLSHLVEAREAFLDVARLPVNPKETTESTKARAESADVAERLDKRIPKLTIKLSEPHPDPSTSVTIDGENVPLAALAIARRLNPGKHTIVVHVEGAVDARKEVELKEKDDPVVEIAVPKAPPKVVVAPPKVVPPPREPGPGPDSKEITCPAGQHGDHGSCVPDASSGKATLRFRIGCESKEPLAADDIALGVDESPIAGGRDVYVTPDARRKAQRFEYVEAQVPAGSHLLRIDPSGCRAEELEINLKPGEVRDVTGTSERSGVGKFIRLYNIALEFAAGGNYVVAKQRIDSYEAGPQPYVRGALGYRGESFLMQVAWWGYPDKAGMFEAALIAGYRHAVSPSWAYLLGGGLGGGFAKSADGMVVPVFVRAEYSFGCNVKLDLGLDAGFGIGELPMHAALSTGLVFRGGSCAGPYGLHL